MEILREKNQVNKSDKGTKVILQKIAQIEMNMKRIESMLEEIERALVFVAKK